MSGRGKSKLGQCAIREIHKYENLKSDFRSVFSRANCITRDCSTGGEAFATDEH